MSYSNIIFNIISGLLYTPWMIRQIGKSNYGLFILAISFLSYLVMDFGLASAIARYISKYRVEKDEQKISNLLGVTIKLYFLIDLLLFGALFILYFFIQDVFVKLSVEELGKFHVIYCIVGFFSLISFPAMSLNGILIAYEKFFILKLCDFLNKVFTILLMIFILIAGYNLYGLIIVNSAVGMIIIMIKIYYLFRKVEIKVNIRYKNASLVKEIFQYSMWVAVIVIAQRLLITIAPSLLGILAGTIQISIFAVGMTFEGYTWIFANALNGLFLPKLSQMALGNENREEIDKLMIKVGRIQLLIVGSLILGFVTLGQEFIILWLGNDFSNSYYVALLLILPGIISLTQDIGVTLLFVINEIKYRAILFISASIISIGLSIMLVPEYGAIGSAIGIFIALILCHIIGMNIIYYKKIKLNIPAYFKECHLKMSVPLIFSLVSGFLIHYYVPAHNLITFIPKAIYFGSVYAILMWTMGLNKDEKNMIRSIGKGIICRLKIAY